MDRFPALMNHALRVTAAVEAHHVFNLGEDIINAHGITKEWDPAPTQSVGRIDRVPNSKSSGYDKSSLIT